MGSTALAMGIVSRRARVAAGSDGSFRNGSGTVVGSLTEDGLLEKRGLDFEKHHLHRFGGWATETRHLEELRNAGGRGIRLVLRDGTVLESSLSAWERHSFRPMGLESDQTVLPDRFWAVHPAGGRQLRLALEVGP